MEFYDELSNFEKEYFDFILDRIKKGKYKKEVEFERKENSFGKGKRFRDEDDARDSIEER
jgi:hypothetical protein